jgi:hypothetical protein
MCHEGPLSGWPKIATSFLPRWAARKSFSNAGSTPKGASIRSESAGFFNSSSHGSPTFQTNAGGLSVVFQAAATSASLCAGGNSPAFFRISRSTRHIGASGFSRPLGRKPASVVRPTTSTCRRASVGPVV